VSIISKKNLPVVRAATVQQDKGPKATGVARRTSKSSVMMSLKNMIKQKVEINIENVVATTSLNQNINIKRTIRNFSAKYNPDKFPGAVIRLVNPRSVILIFKSGSIVCTGTKSEKMAEKAIQEFVSELNRTTKLENATFQEIKIENIVASCNLKNRIHLEQAARILPRSLYEPEQFPGIIHRTCHPKTVLLLFASGRLVCTGAKSTQEVNSSVNAIHMELEQMGLIVHDSDGLI